MIKRASLSVILVAIYTLVTAQIERVEPPFWWIGFQNKSVELLIYGDEIGNYKPSVDAEGVKLQRITKVSNPNYLFLELLIADETEPGDIEIVFQSPKGKILTYAYELRSRKVGSDSRRGFDASDAIYLITPDRFANGDPSNDQVAGMLDMSLDRSNLNSRHGGDIAGITEHLDYIKEMGFTAIWSTPMLENDMSRDSYHGYAITDFYKNDPRFGSNSAYLDLCKKANEKGLLVIMDMVFNHCGSEHWWMKDLPSKSWINNEGVYMPCNHRRTVNQSDNCSEYDKKMMSDGWFVETMPDLNQRNREMANYLTQNSIWWIELAGLGGIRMDTWPYPDPDMMAEWSCRIVEEYPDFSIVGEEWSMNPAIVSYWQRGKENFNGYATCQSSLMDFPVGNALVSALTDDETWATGWIELYEKLANDFQYPNPMDLVVFPDNHDMDRFYKQIGTDFELAKMGMAFFATIRGIPQFYYGTEVLLNNPNSDAHGELRKDFPGGWSEDSVSAFTGKNLSANQAEMQRYLKKLLNWRKTSKAVTTGDFIQFAPYDGIYTYFRFVEDELVMVVFNKNRTEIELSTERYQEMLRGAISGRNVLTDVEFSFENGIAVPARSALIIEVDRPNALNE